MEIPISAEVAGTVTKIVTNEGDFVNVDEPLVEIE